MAADEGLYIYIYIAAKVFENFQKLKAAVDSFCSAFLCVKQTCDFCRCPHMASHKKLSWCVF